MINFLKDKNKLRDVATLTTATLATLSLAATNPAVAALFKIGFCGNFDDGGQVLLGSSITVDTAQTVNYGFGSVPKVIDAEITTARPSQPNVTYTEEDFFLAGVTVNGLMVDGQPGVDIDQNTAPFPVETVYWRFDDGGNGNNFFNVALPQSIFPLRGQELGNWNFNSDIRVGFAGSREKDPRVRIIPVPEPTSILGTAIAIGLGGMLSKKNLSMLKDDKEAA